jgi:RNase P subunit RPR2
MTDTTKHILIDNTEKETEQTNPKIPRKKIASQSDNWINTAKTYSTQETQLALLVELHRNISSDSANLLLTHLKTKQSGYRSQDTLKGLYDPDRFIQIPRLIELLIESKLACFYCRKWATLFYENVRDPRQWSLERLSNAEGHNRDNVVIACLECNMRRRTMYYERYIATKQLKVNKLDSESYENDVASALP